MDLAHLLISNRHLYMSGAMLSVDLRMDTKKTCVYKTLNNVLKFCYGILGSIVNIIGWIYMTIQ